MRRRTLFLLLLCVALFALGAVLFFLNYRLLDYREVPVDFNVRPGVAGLNVDTDALHLGGIPPGGASERTMTITPSRDAHLVIRFSGNTSPYLSVDKNDFPVARGEAVPIHFYANISNTTPEGVYNGTATFYFYRR